MVAEGTITSDEYMKKLTDFVGGVLDSLLNFSEYGSGAYHTALTAYNAKTQAR